MIKDNIVEAVRQDLLERSERGINKYGTTLDRSDLELRDWLQHAYEECLDQANYLKRAIVETDNEVIQVDVNSPMGRLVQKYIKNIYEADERIADLEASILVLRNAMYVHNITLTKEEFDGAFGITTQRAGEVMVENGDSLPEVKDKKPTLLTGKEWKEYCEMLDFNKKHGN